MSDNPKHKVFARESHTSLIARLDINQNCFDYISSRFHPIKKRQGLNGFVY